MQGIPAFFAQTLPDLPASAWLLAPVILLLLAAAAAVDALTGRVPDPLIFAGLLLTTAVRGFLADWQPAANYLMMALAAGFLVWGLNQIWYRFTKRDALGMGDGKWTMLAVAAFGPLPAAIAWGSGACLALAWLGALRLIKRKTARVHFAPFLMLGLVAGVWWLRLR